MATSPATPTTRAAARPLVIQILSGTTLIAEARALLFRVDLLAAGLSHGHHGFSARLRAPLKAGPAKLTIQCGAVRKLVAVKCPKPLTSAPASVETLLGPPPTWTAADFLSKPDCLPWAIYAARLGTGRFVDAAFRFTLHRWPSKAEAAVHARTLDRGQLPAQDFLVRLLQSLERADLGQALMSPFDSEFGF